MSTNRLTRRAFLNGAAVAGVATLIAACAPKIVKETVVVKETVKETVVVAGTPQVVEREVTKVVEKVVEKEVTVAAPKGAPTVVLSFHGWVTQELPVDNMLRQYNEEHPEVKIEINRAADEWQQKHLAAVRSGEALWNAHCVFTPWMQTRESVKMGLIQAWDPYLAASSQPSAATILDDMLDVVRPQMIYEGKVMGMPMDMDDTCFGMNVNYTDAVGLTEVPKTWEDVTEVAREIRGKFKDEGVYGICSSEWYWIYDGPGAIHYNVSKKPFTDEGIMDITSEEFLWALDLCKMWQDEELSPTMAAPPLDLWKKGKIAMCVEAGAFVFWGQRVWGKDAIADPKQLPQYPGGGGCAAETMGMCLLAGAPHPQEAVDFLVWLFGPANADMQAAICSTAKTPAYKSTYENIVKANPDWQWMLGLLEMLNRSIPLTHTASYAIQYDATTSWMQKYFLNQESDPKVAMESCLKEITDRLATMS